MPDVQKPAKANETNDKKSEAEQQKKQLAWRRRQMWMLAALAHQGKQT